MLKRVLLSIAGFILTAGILSIAGCELLSQIEDTFGSLKSSYNTSNSSSGGSTSSKGILILWSKFDSPTDVSVPSVGSGGSIFYTNFVPGRYSNAYAADYSHDFQVSFPVHIPNKGCIEFWAQLSNYTGTSVIGQPTYLFDIYYGLELEYRISLNGNDGYGGGGLSGNSGQSGDYATGGLGSYTYNQVLNNDASVWHHYALVWDINGIIAGTNLQLYIDGALSPCGYYRHPTVFPSESTNATLNIVENDNSFGIILFDNLKIWNYAKTDFSDRFVE